MQRPKRVLIDCDPGIDDALALLLAFASDRLKVEAVTTVYGNVGVWQCTENLINILALSGVKTMPEIGIGSERPLVKDMPKPRMVHGKDGLGDTFLGHPRVKLKINDAVQLASSMILSERIDYIIATGPLTNIAKVLAKDPQIAHLLKRIYIMAGALFVKGNMTPCAEFNIYNDPEAAKQVLDSDAPKTVAGLDVTRKVLLEKKDLFFLRERKDRLSRFIIKIADYAIDYHKRFRSAKGAYMNDPLCVGLAIDEGICKYERVKLDVVLDGAERGRVSVKKGRSNTLYCKDVNEKKFKRLFLKNLKCLIARGEN